jgi:hypothetical protein
LQWGHIKPFKKEGAIVAATVVVYHGDDEEYFSFITPESYHHLERWIEYRQDCGEKISGDSWVMRRLWNTKLGHYHHGMIKASEKLKPSGVKRLIEDALWTQGIRKKSDLKGNRYEFQTDHGLRKWFKTRCEIAGMKSINIEKLMGHSIGISDSYYRATENELLEDYLKAIPFLTIGTEDRLQMQMEEVLEQSRDNDALVKSQLYEKEHIIAELSQENLSNTDAISALSDQIAKFVKEIEILKKEFNASD